MDPHGLYTVVNFVGFLALFVVFGLVISKLWLVPSSAFADPDLALRWRQMVNESLALLTFAGVALLFARAAVIDDESVETPFADLPLLLSKTHFGCVWSVHLSALAVLSVCARLFVLGSRSSKWAAMPVCIAGLVIAFTYSASSHASDDGDFTLSELNDWMHIVSTAVWGGAILASSLLVIPSLKRHDSALSNFATRLSDLAAVALAVVLITGIVNACLQLPNWEALIATNYGRLLSVKVAIVLAMVSIGAFNRFVAIPRIRRYTEQHSNSTDSPSCWIRRALAVDAVLVIAALIMAAALVQIETPRGLT
jgi:putative copper resistance protein D